MYCMTIYNNIIIKKKHLTYLNECKQHAPTVVKHIVLYSFETFGMGNDKVILHDLLSVLHILPTLQQWLNAVSKFPLNDKKLHLRIQT